jgi:hypothetical protein
MQTISIDIDQQDTASPAIKYTIGLDIQKLSNENYVTLYTAKIDGDSCPFDTTQLSRLSYRSILHTFPALITRDMALI